MCNAKHVQYEICVILDLNVQCRTMCDLGTASVAVCFMI